MGRAIDEKPFAFNHQYIYVGIYESEKLAKWKRKRSAIWECFLKEFLKLKISVVFVEGTTHPKRRRLAGKPVSFGIY